MSGMMNTMAVVMAVVALFVGSAFCFAYQAADDEDDSVTPACMGPVLGPDAAEEDLDGSVPAYGQDQMAPMDGQNQSLMPQMPMNGQNQMPMGPQSQSQNQMPTDSQSQMAPMDGQNQMSGQGQMPQMPMNGQNQNQMPQMNEQGQMVPMDGQTQWSAASSGSAGEVVTSATVNTAKDLVVDMENATVVVMSDENNQVTVSESGTYVVTGTCSDGNVVVKKGTTGVVLVLKDLDLTSTTGATVSLNKYTEVKLVVEGQVKLTDAEDPADEDSADADVADAFDGAALKAKDGSRVYLTGTGTLTIDASSCKNGVKVGSEETTSFVMDGSLTVYVTAANDGLNSGYDLVLLSGTLVVTAGDDAVHADRVLTLGSSDGTGPSVTVKSSNEGLEGTVVNLFGGSAVVNSTDDAVNAANSDGTYVGTLEYSVNVTGGTWTLVSGADGVDSNGNVNLVGGTVTIRSASTGGDAGIDYDGSLFVSENVRLDNRSGVSGADMMPGQSGGQFPGAFGRMMPAMA